MEEALRANVVQSLNMYVHQNAIFFAERLFYEYPSQTNLRLFAHTYQSSGDAGTACRLLQHHYPFDRLPPQYGKMLLTQEEAAQQLKGTRKTPLWECTYLYGVSCTSANRFGDAEKVFLSLAPELHAEVSYWLGHCHRRLSRRNFSDQFVRSVQLNPCMFVAYEHAVQYGGAFETNPYKAHIIATEKQLAEQPQEFPIKADLQAERSQGSTPSMSRETTPPSGPTGVQRTIRVVQPAPKPAPRVSGVTLGKTERHSNVPDLGKPPGIIRQPALTQEKNINIFSTPGESQQWNPNPTATLDGVLGVLRMLKRFAEAFKALHCYNCAQAIELLQPSAITPQQASSGWVLSNSGLASFHSSAFQQCVQTFSTLRQEHPWLLNTSALIYYSTALWQLKQDAQLGVLAHSLVEHMPMSPVTLCVVGNCYSLARDAKTAMVMFTRAVQLDATVSYAHTLRGYELLAMDQRNDAEHSFREALRYDPRHYSAAAGLGEMYFRMETDGKARSYFQAALDINQLPTVLNRMAATYHRPGASPDSLLLALKYYDRALEKAPKNYVAQHQRANLLMRLRQLGKALEALEKLVQEAPDEAQVHITLGTCLARQGDNIKAIHAFNRAADLDNGRAAFVRSCLERITNGTFDEDEE